MAEVIKLLNAERTLGATANDVGLAVLVRVTNANTTTASLITVVPSSGSNTTVTLLPSSAIELQKPSDAKLVSSLTSLVTAVSVAFS